MNMIPVTSSNIHSCGHEERTGLMKVRFHSGQEYLYGSVPKEKFEALLAAPSVGSFFQKEIKANKAHAYVKMEEPKE